MGAFRPLAIALALWLATLPLTVGRAFGLTFLAALFCLGIGWGWHRRRMSYGRAS